MNKKSLNLLIMIVALVLLPVSGAMLASSHGRPETDPVRHAGHVLHTVSALAFLVTAVIHGSANRKALARIFVKNNSAR